MIKITDGREDGDATGVLGEDAMVACEASYEASGNAKCIVDTPQKGKWFPVSECVWIPPNEPPDAFCKALPEHYKSQDCEDCPAVQPGQDSRGCNCLASGF